MNSIPVVCKIDNCLKKPTCKGYCNPHYQKWHRTGDPLYVHQFQYLYGTKFYRHWTAMIARTTYKSQGSYKNYGGRGIKVCERWHVPMNLYEDIGDVPSKLHSIDRIDVNGNYSCGNCVECKLNNWPLNVRWATIYQQGHNTRKSKPWGYYGICKKPHGYVVQISVNNITQYLGSFKDPEEAALQYDRAAIFFRGHNADTNFL